MEATQSHLDQILDEIASLSLDEQEVLLDILKKRNIEQKRLRVAREVKEAQRAQEGADQKGHDRGFWIKDLESD